MIPAVPGVVTGEDIAATAASIAAVQLPDGGIPWPEGHVDAWNHVECLMAMTAAGLREASLRGYEWLRRHQRADGSWPMKVLNGEPLEDRGESNHAALCRRRRLARPARHRRRGVRPGDVADASAGPSTS